MSNSSLGEFRFERAAPRHQAIRTFFLTLLVIGGVYGVWLLAFWPGFLGEDSLAVILEIESNGTFQSRKPVFWYYFIKLLSGPHEWIETPIAVQLIITTIIFSRILSWCLLQQMKNIFIFGLVFICLAPNMIFFAGLLYADGIFSVCAVGLLFEFWLIAQRRSIRALSLAMIAISLPFAAFARANGFIFLMALVPLFYVLRKADRLKLAAVTLAWLAAVWVGGQAHKTAKHGALFPLALFETVNFLQPRPMNLWPDSPRVSETTVQILTQRQPLAKILESYDPDYWDTLVYKQGGADFLALTRDQKKKIVSEFFRYNLWRNIPDFLGSRVNIFLVATLAKGGFPSLDDSARIIKSTRIHSEFRSMNMQATEAVLRTFYEFSYSVRWLLWSPLFGIFLTFLLFRSGLKRRDFPTLLVTIPMLAQLGGIFLFSIAGEYRYLLPYFVLPLVLLPILEIQRRQTGAA